MNFKFKKLLVLCLSLILLVITAVVFTQAGTGDCTHNYLTVYEWADDYSSCKELKKCENCGDVLSSVDSSKVNSVQKQCLTCTTDEVFSYEAVFLDSAKLQTKTVVTQKAWGHDVQNLSDRKPTCTETGLTAGSRCKRCYETIEPQLTVEALGHDTVHHEGKTANCTEDGWDAYETCTRCDYSSKKTINKLGHDITEHEAKAPTCTEDGWNAYETCSRCDYTTFEEIPATGHGKTKTTYTWADDYSKCTEVIACSVCGEELSTRDAAAISTEYISVANCTLDTKIKYKAQFLGDGKTVYSDEIVTEKAWGHDVQILEAQEPNCEQEGLTAGSRCKRCDETIEARETIPPLGHDVIKHEAKAPTCTEAGWEAYETCSRCYYTTFKEVPACHGKTKKIYTWAKDYSKCTEATVCTVCGEELSTRDAAAISTEYISVANCTLDTKIKYKAQFLGDGKTVYSDEIVTEKAWGHDVQILEAQEPVCEQEGLTAGSRCKRCDETIEARESIPPLGHDVIKHEAKAPTCTEAGWDAYETCSRCYYTTFKEIPATGHGKTETTYTWADDYSKCTEVTVCTVCGEELSTRDAAAISTEYISVANCTLDGKVKYKAQFLGDGKTVYSDEIVTEKAWGHDVQILEAQEPTCEQEGLTAGSRCKRCGETIEARESIPPLGHGKTKTTYTWADDYSKCTEATVCTVCGEELSTRDAAAISTEYISVANCTLDTKIKYKAQFLGDGKTVYSDEIVTEKAWGHDVQILEAQEPTCEQEGLTEGSRCMRCDETIEARESIPPLGHDVIKHEAKAPTCTEAGWDAYETCSRCYHTTFKEIPATGHGKTETTYTWADDYSKCTEATVCTVCGEELSTRDAAAISTEYISVANCTLDGKIKYKAQFLGDGKTVYSDEIVTEKAWGHNEQILEAKESTCEQEGLTEGKKCSVCDETLVAQTVVAKKEHTKATREENKVEATCKKAGSVDVVTYCSVCNEVLSTETKVIEKLPHKETALKAVAATCTKTGLTAGKKCTVCGTVTVAQKTVTKKAHTNKTTTTKATLTKDGKIETKCSVCGKVSKTTKIAYPKTITLSATKYTYTGKAINPTVTVKGSDGKVIASSNYTVTKKNNTNVGTATVTITFKGNYSGTKTLKFSILPKQVTGLKASKVSTTAVALAWTKVPGAKYYKVEQSTNGKKWTTIGTVTANSLTVKKLKTGAKYQYRVTAMDSTKKLIGKSSAVLKTGTLTAAPTVTLKSTKSKTATASWKKVAGASSYVVYKSTDGKKWTKVGSTTGTSYNLTKLTVGKKIYVKVYAVNAYKQNSAASAVKNVTVKK